MKLTPEQFLMNFLFGFFVNKDILHYFSKQKAPKSTPCQLAWPHTRLNILQQFAGMHSYERWKNLTLEPYPSKCNTSRPRFTRRSKRLQCPLAWTETFPKPRANTTATRSTRSRIASGWLECFWRLCPQTLGQPPGLRSVFWFERTNKQFCLSSSVIGQARRRSGDPNHRQTTHRWEDLLDVQQFEPFFQLSVESCWRRISERKHFTGISPHWLELWRNDSVTACDPNWNVSFVKLYFLLLENWLITVEKLRETQTWIVLQTEGRKGVVTHLRLQNYGPEKEWNAATKQTRNWKRYNKINRDIVCLICLNWANITMNERAWWGRGSHTRRNMEITEWS